MKESFYFPHDYSARNDDKILSLRAEYGMEGYGIFWAIIEVMSENESTMFNIKLIKGVSLSLFVDVEKIEKIIDFCVDISLFSRDGDFIFSRRLLGHKNTRKLLSEAGKKGAAKRWGESQKNSLAINPPLARKGKERKGEERKGNKTDIKKAEKMDLFDFEKFYGIYPRKVAKGKAEDLFLKLEKSLLPQIIEAVTEQIPFFEKKDIKYTPHPTTWLNQKRWTDEVEKEKPITEMTSIEIWEKIKNDPDFEKKLKNENYDTWYETYLAHNS